MGCDHSQRVATLAVGLARSLGAKREFIQSVSLAGLLHDIGKQAIPLEILDKPGRLTEHEFQIIRTHPQHGHDLLSRLPGFEPILPAVLLHHERFDGGGYPHGLSGRSIPLIARIIALADAFDAMVSDRPYQAARSIPDAMNEVRAGSGAHFDPSLVSLFLGEVVPASFGAAPIPVAERRRAA
ncbi:MAG: HD-GYP domain-containing protein [Phycisphaerales bacterium]